MIKKFKILALIGVMLIMSGCGKSEVVQQPTVVIDETSVFDSTKIDGDNITWTSDMQNKLLDNLKNATYMEFTQSTKNMSKENNSVFTFINYDVKVSSSTKVSQTIISSGDSVSTEETKEGYTSDLLNDLYYKDTETGWVEAEKQTKELSWNLKELNNAYDMLNQMVDLSNLQPNTIGKLQDKYIYLEYTCPIKDNAVFGLNYSELGDNTVIFIIDKEKMLPTSVISNPDYKLDSDSFVLQSAIILNNISSNNLTLDTLGIAKPEGFKE